MSGRRNVKMIGIVVTGHGHFPSGLLSAIELVAGKPENVTAVDFEDVERKRGIDAKSRRVFLRTLSFRRSGCGCALPISARRQIFREGALSFSRAAFMRSPFVFCV